MINNRQPQKPTVQCLACNGWFQAEPHTNVIYPICDGCLASQKGQHETGRTLWRVYLCTDLTDQGIGPFYTRQERNTFFANVHRTHPHLAAKMQQIRVFEESINPPGKRT